MNLKKLQEGTKLTVAPEGRLDAVTAPEFTQELRGCLDGVTELVIDLAGLEYISSAGLRALLEAHKVMMEKGEMTVIHVEGVVREIFEATGFLNVLNVRED